MYQLFRKHFLLMFSLVLFSAVSPAWGDDVIEDITPTAAPVEAATPEEAPAKANNDDALKISGFIDVSYSLMADKKFKSSANTFGMDQVEVDLEKSWGDVSIRADLESLPSSGTPFAVEQAYVSYTFSKSSSVMAGTFLAPIGWEILDPVDMYQFSHSFLFLYGVPTFYTGVMASFVAGPVDAVVYVSNGMDTYVDANESKAAGTRVGITPVEDVNIGLSYVYNTNDVMIADMDFTLALGDTTIGGEVNYGNDSPAGGKGSWMGALLVGAFSLSDDIGLTLRSDWFNDDAGRVAAVKATYINGTISPNYSIADNALILFEYTYGYMEAAGTTAGTHLAALEMTYSF